MRFTVSLPAASAARTVGLRGVKAARRWAAALAAGRTPRRAAPVSFVVSGGLEQMYQARQWLWELERLSDAWRPSTLPPVQLVVRDALVAVRLAGETRLPVVHARTTGELARVLGEGALLALYPNQTTLNFQALAAPGPAHAHLSHGESEKISMVSNQLKAYDAVFTAGAAARRRIARHLIGFDEASFVDVGRPQLDEPRPVPAALPATSRPTVLYAPTWEGDSAAMSYSSLASSGPAIVRELLSAGRRVIYRPHPQSGTRSASARRAHADIVGLLKPAGTDHFVDEGTAVGWQFDAAEEFVLDLSAMAYDALSTGKPMVVFRPPAGAHVQADGLLGHVESFGSDAVGQLAQLLETSGSAEAKQRRLTLSADHFGDTSPGAAIDRFIRACQRVADERAAALRDRAAREGADKEK